MEDLLFVNKNDLSLNTMVQTKDRLILPPIITRQRTSSGLISSATSTTLDNDTNNKFTLPSRQSTFMKSISEIS